MTNVLNQGTKILAMTLKRISFVYLSLLVLNISSIANEVTIEIDRKYMNKEWSFLPDVPSSFDKNQSKEVKVGLNYKKLYLNISESNVALDLKRFSEPKNVSLNAKKKALSIGYLFNNDDYLGYTFARPGIGQPALISGPDDSIVLGKNEYLFFGDNTENSMDGRYFGAVEQKMLLGSAFFVALPFDRAGFAETSH